MTVPVFQVLQLADECSYQNPASRASYCWMIPIQRFVLFAFAAGRGLAEHVAPLPAFIQIIKGEATLTVGDELVAGKPGTWIQMAAGTPHSIRAESAVVMLLTLLK